MSATVELLDTIAMGLNSIADNTSEWGPGKTASHALELGTLLGAAARQRAAAGETAIELLREFRDRLRGPRRGGWTDEWTEEIDAVLPHERDEDCDVDPVTATCRGCGVWHGEPCAACGGRGFHRDGCSGALEEDDDDDA